MRTKPSRVACVVVSLVALVIAGCSGGGPTTYKVSGTITFEGQPVADAQVGFVPDGGGEVKPARGQTDASGRYTLRTYDKPGQDSAGCIPPQVPA